MIYLETDTGLVSERTADFYFEQQDILEIEMEKPFVVIKTTISCNELSVKDNKVLVVVPKGIHIPTEIIYASNKFFHKNPIVTVKPQVIHYFSKQN